MIKVLLWDIDGTLLDFLKAEHEAIKGCFRAFQLGECTDKMIARYSLINKSYWERLERGEISKREVLIGRFRQFFQEEGIHFDRIEEFNKEYQIRLGDTICFCDNSYELIKNLKYKVKQYAVTNGTKVAQDRKLKKSGLIELFDDVFISEEVGVEKPGLGFFEYVFSVIGSYELDEIMIVGDSLTSDMKGGNNAGIKCCWYNPKRVENTKNVNVDYEICDLNDVLKIIK